MQDGDHAECRGLDATEKGTGLVSERIERAVCIEASSKKTQSRGRPDIYSTIQVDTRDSLASLLTKLLARLTLENLTEKEYGAGRS